MNRMCKELIVQILFEWTMRSIYIYKYVCVCVVSVVFALCLSIILSSELFLHRHNVDNTRVRGGQIQFLSDLVWCVIQFGIELAVVFLTVSLSCSILFSITITLFEITGDLKHKAIDRFEFDFWLKSAHNSFNTFYHRNECSVYDCILTFSCMYFMC